MKKAMKGGMKVQKAGMKIDAPEGGKGNNKKWKQWKRIQGNYTERQKHLPKLTKE